MTAHGRYPPVTLETENDVDWDLLYVETYSQLDISAEMTKSCLYNGTLTLRDLDGEYIDSFNGLC
jgi:hypothetical protein